MSTLDLWWSSLTIAQKERIATKATNCNYPHGVTHVLYPACTLWWNAQNGEAQQAIYDHCTDAHGILLPDW